MNSPFAIIRWPSLFIYVNILYFESYWTITNIITSVFFWLVLVRHNFFVVVKILFLRAVLVSQGNWGEGTQIIHLPSYQPPPQMHSFSHYQHYPPERFICYNEPTLAHYNHPKSIVYIIAHSWCCTFYEFVQIYNDMYLSLYHTEHVHGLPNPLCFTIHSFSPPISGSHWSLYCLHGLPFPRCHIVWITYGISFSSFYS